MSQATMTNGKQYYSTHKEALYIRLTGTEKVMNRDEGVTISDCRTALLSYTIVSASVASSSIY